MRCVLLGLAWLCASLHAQSIPFPGPGVKGYAAGGGITRTGTPTECRTSTTVTNAAGFNCAYTATTGNALRVVVVGENDSAGGTVTSCSDGAGNTYSLKGTQPASSTGITAGILHANNITGGSLTINCKPVTSTPVMTIFVVEYSGVSSAGTMDGTAGGSCKVAGTGICLDNVGANATTAGQSTDSLTTSNAADLIIGVVATDSGGNPCTLSPLNSFSFVLTESNGMTFGCSGFAERIVSSTGTYALQATIDSGVPSMTGITASH